MLSAHDPVPLIRVVCPLKYKLSNLDEWGLSLGALIQPLFCELLPPAALPIDSPDLLLEDGRVPFGVELHDDAAGLVEVQPFPSDLALRDEDPRRRAGPVERGLEVPSSLPPRRALKQSRVEALATVVILEERVERLLAKHRLLLIDVLVPQFAEQRAQTLLYELPGQGGEALVGHLVRLRGRREEVVEDERHEVVLERALQLAVGGRAAKQRRV